MFQSMDGPFHLDRNVRIADKISISTHRANRSCAASVDTTSFIERCCLRWLRCREESDRKEEGIKGSPADSGSEVEQGVPVS